MAQSVWREPSGGVVHSDLRAITRSPARVTSTPWFDPRIPTTAIVAMSRSSSPDGRRLSIRGEIATAVLKCRARVINLIRNRQWLETLSERSKSNMIQRIQS